MLHQRVPGDRAEKNVYETGEDPRPSACGEEAAQRLAEQRKKQIAPAYNKGAYQVINPDNIVDIGK